MYEISVENLDEDIRIFLYLQGVYCEEGHPYNSLHNINRYIILRAQIQSLGYLGNNLKGVAVYILLLAGHFCLFNNTKYGKSLFHSCKAAN